MDLKWMRNYRHGFCRNGKYPPELSAYYAARSRCSKPKHPSYKNYGGRGIRFLFTSFAEFFAEVGPRPSKYHTLERINNNRN
jgi:hypothetical protein